MPIQPNWSKIRETLWSQQTVAAIVMLPNAYPISLWFFTSSPPITFDFSRDWPDVVGQSVLAVITIMFAIAAGVAIDIGLVKIATSAPTHSQRFKSLTFWIPLLFCMMCCIVIYDYYSHHLWVWSMTTATHLAYPIASMSTALFWSWSRDWVAEVTAPLRSEVDVLTMQIESWKDRFQLRVDEAHAELTAKVLNLTDRLTRETERANQNEQRGKEVGTILEQVGEAHAQMTSDLRIQFQKTLVEQSTLIKNQAQAEIDRLSAKVHEVQDAAARQKERDQKLIEDLTHQVHRLTAEVEDSHIASTPLKFASTADGIRALLSEDRDRPTDELALELNVPLTSSFRTQVSRERRSIPESMAA